MKPLSVPGLRVLTLLAILSLLVALPSQAAPTPARQPAPPPDASGPRLFLPVVLGPVVPKTSFQLIDDAVKAGRLDAETALVYKAYAITLDPHLPAQYRGADKRELESDILRDVVRRWPTLSARTQALLAPFITPPMYEGSWADPHTAWGFGNPEAGVTQPAIPRDDGVYCWSSSPPLPGPRPGWQRLTTAHASVWYETAGDIFPGDYVLATPEQVEATAHLVASVIEKIITEETGLMEDWPLPDTAEECNGGDGGIDIYVSRRSVKTGAQAVPYAPGEWGRPGYIWIAPDFTGQDLKLVRDTLAHEFFHLISMRYPVAEETAPNGVLEYGWLDEASANYMVEYVYHEDQFEHWAAPAYLTRDYQWPLEYTEIGKAWLGENGYSDYVFILFLAHRLTPKVLRDIWRNTPTLDSLASINEATKGSGGFEKLWPEWALVAWNDWENEFLDDLHRWDALEPGVSKATNPSAPQQVVLNGKRWDQQYPQYGGVISHLAIGMSRHVFSDPTVRSVRFNNTLTKARGAFVWGLTKIGGKWEVHNWTKEPEKLFCRQLPDERLEELVLLITNSVYDDRQYELELPSDEAYPTVQFSNLACAGWQGTATTVWREDRGARWEQQTMHTTATFEPFPGSTTQFRVKTGTMHWEFDGSNGSCSMVSPTVDWPLKNNGGTITIRYWWSDMSILGQYDITGSADYYPIVTFVCRDGSYDYDWITHNWVSTGHMSLRKVSADGRTLSGHYEWGLGGYTSVSDWNFTAIEPGE